MSLQKSLSAFCAGAVVVLVLYAIFFRSHTPPTQTTATSTPELVAGQNAPAAPSLERPVTNAKIAATVQNLHDNPQSYDDWFALGYYRKQAADYEGAAQAWEWLVVNNQTRGPLVYNNLGDLYMNFLKDYPKAVANYKAAIVLNETNIDFYRNLFVLYSQMLKDPAAARAVLQQGLKANPNNPDLLEIQRSYTQ